MSKLTFKQMAPFTVLLIVALLAMFVKPEADYVPGPSDPQYSSSDMAWVRSSRT